MYGLGLGAFNLYGIIKLPEAYYSDAIKYRKGSRKKSTHFNILPANKGFTVTQTSCNDTIMGSLFAKTKEIGHFDEAADALRHVKDVMADIIGQHHGTMSRTYAPIALHEYQWVPLRALDEAVKNGILAQDAQENAYKATPDAPRA